jgi:hypothetical protein
MIRIVGALGATYNFFTGDAILLTASILAFVLAGTLAHFVHAPGLFTGLAFLALLAGGLVITLAREAASHRR